MNGDTERARDLPINDGERETLISVPVAGSDGLDE